MNACVPTKLMKSLHRAQDGNCFHCAEAVALVWVAGTPKKDSITQEHVFPHATTGKGLIHNIVIAHARCNYERGDRQPTPDEIARAARIYKHLGLTPFVLGDSDEGRKILSRGDKAA